MPMIRKALMRLIRSVGLSLETFASAPEFLKSLFKMKTSIPIEKFPRAIATAAA